MFLCPRAEETVTGTAVNRGGQEQQWSQRSHLASTSALGGLVAKAGGAVDLGDVEVAVSEDPTCVPSFLAPFGLGVPIPGGGPSDVLVAHEPGSGGVDHEEEEAGDVPFKNIR